MFFGETAITLDSKGRMAIPTRYRQAVAVQCNNRLVLTYSAFDNGVLWLYPEKKWEEVRDQVMRLSASDQNHRSVQRRLVGSATPIEPDGAGRIQLPQTLRQVAGLEKRAVLMGMGDRFELWNESVLNQKRAEEFANDDAASSEMSALEL